jgi:hypothetical protein
MLKLLRTLRLLPRDQSVPTPRGRIMERRGTPAPRAAMSAKKGAGTAVLSLLGITAPAILMWLTMPDNVKLILKDLPINPAYMALIVSIVTGLAKFGWDYFSRKVKHAANADWQGDDGQGGDGGSDEESVAPIGKPGVRRIP